MKKTVIATVALGVLASCAADGRTPFNGRDRIKFDGATFRADAKRVSKDDISYFTTEVRPASQTITGARAAALHESTRYCIENFGTSRIKWTIGPDTDPSALLIRDDRLTYQGRCQR